MNKTSIFFVVSLLLFGRMAQSEATLIRIVPPESVINSPQSLEAVIVEMNGNAFKQTVYYNPIDGGIEMDTKWAGPNASIYIPNWKTGYIWHNCYWIDEAGHYWDGSRKTAIDMPDWRNQWVGYWHRYWHDKRGYWPSGDNDKAEDRKRYGRFQDQRQIEGGVMKGVGEVNEMPSTKMESTPMVPENR